MYEFEYTDCFNGINGIIIILMVLLTCNIFIQLRIENNIKFQVNILF